MPRRLVVPMSLAVLAVLGTGCGGDPAAPDPEPASTGAGPASQAAGLQVGGEYETEVRLLDSTCRGIGVESQPTTVDQRAGDTAIVLVHAGLSYDGTVGDDGAFTTTPEPVEVGEATHTLTISGRFSLTGFEATVEADVRSPAEPACRYRVRWVGTKDGEPNVLPNRR